MVDSGSSINIMYLDTLQKMNLTEANLRRTNTIFHGVVPGREARSLGCITVKVAFGDVNNYHQERMTLRWSPSRACTMSYSAKTYSTPSWPSHASSTTNSRYPEALPKLGTTRLDKQPTWKLSSTTKNSRRSRERSMPRRCPRQRNRFPTPLQHSRPPSRPSRWNLW